MKAVYVSTKQANLMLLAVSLLILIGSSFLLPVLGIGCNLWVNELLWILTPVLIVSGCMKLPVKKIFKIQKPSGRNVGIGMLSAACMWLFSGYLSKGTRILLNNTIGNMDTGLSDASTKPAQAYLILIAMLFLAPICEELLFRGFILSAYERYNKRYGYVLTAVLFGMLHVMNGMTEVVPAFLAGLLLGYLVYKTGSILVSMAAHMAFNLSSVIFVGALGLNSLSSIPIWFHFIAFGGLAASILLLGSIRVLKPVEKILAETIKQEDNDSTTDLLFTIKNEDEEEEARTVDVYSLGSKITFALAGLFVIMICVLEIYLRIRS